ncbi:thioredoxin family protein [Legionella impletisoli]|uniref:Thioredoxin family protein n=1 Tax=Legionella impletisoli TaxID=343510 RepID=A0A917JNJ5_9GAMM|nr:thioredoxin family protein [Legionella impletisoli]GGI77097.1 thioredoxin family protein [Legionella impletisoli]
MVRTPSTMVELGTEAPEFTLTDVISGSKISLKHYQGLHATVIMFICNHCPYVKHVNHELTRLANDYQPKGVNFIAINSNDVENYPDDSPLHMIQTAKENNYSFPYLFDETQEVARAYQAACTPDFYVFDDQLKLVYRGQLDDSRPGNTIKPDGSSIRSALDSLLAGEPVSKDQKPSLGCNIKWKE